MPKIVSFGAKTYSLPLTSEEEYWDDLVDFLSDIPSGVFQKDSGLFELTQEIDFGDLHGVKAKYWKSRSGNEANTGTVRLNKDDFIAFRNEANTSDVTLAKDNEDFLTFNNTRLLVDPTTTEGDTIVRSSSGNLTRKSKVQSDPTPLGTLIAVDSRYATVPTNGEISAEGYALCNGQALSGLAGHELSGSETHLPDMTDGRYLKGSSSSGTRSGSNTTTLTVNNIPSHTHDSGSYKTSVSLNGSAPSLTGSAPSLTGSTRFASESHDHGAGTLGVAITQGSDNYMYFRSNIAESSAPGFTATDAFYGQRQVVAHGPRGKGIMCLGRVNNIHQTSTVGITGGSYSLSNGSYSLTGSNNVTGTSSSTGSGTSFSNEPQHHTVVYLMKVKKV